MSDMNLFSMALGMLLENPSSMFAGALALAVITKVGASCVLGRLCGPLTDELGAVLGGDDA